MTEKQGAAGPQGQRGRPGQEGRPGLPGISQGAKRAAFALLVLVLLVGGGNLWATYDLNQSTKAGLQREQQQYEAGQRRTQAAAAAAQLKNAKGTCSALVGLDDARIGAMFAPASATGIPLTDNYGYRLSQHIHDVVKSTHCAALLAGNAAGAKR